MPSTRSGVSMNEFIAVKAALRARVNGSWRKSDQYIGTWIALPEIPTSQEILKHKSKKVEGEEEWNEYQQEPIYDPNLSINIVKGPWPDRRSYLEAHYNILREDAVAPLRNAVKDFAITPQMFEDKDIRIYTRVRPTGLLLSRLGPAVRVEFSTERIDKQVRWNQSPRLTQGTMVALSPAEDMFMKVCTVATVAARPVAGGLDQNPPTVDLFWGGFTELNIDPNQEWVMIEARGGYFEAYRNTLVGLQMARTEKFPLSTQIVKVHKGIDQAHYVKTNPYLNLSSLEIPNRGFENTLVEAAEKIDLSNVNVLKDFPKDFNNGMDDSQLDACKAMLTHRVAIIQGPPGTGKTFVSVAALKIQIENLREGDPPIIVAAQTNHALDQLLTHIMKFETNIVRLGGRSERENEAIRKRTLYELRQANRHTGDVDFGLKVCAFEYQKVCKEIEGILSPLRGGTIFSAQSLVDYGILTEQQRMSLTRADWSDDEDDWGKDSEEEEKAASVKKDIDPDEIIEIRDWLGPKRIISMPRTPPTHHGLDVEEEDPAFDQLKAIKESVLHDDTDRENLEGLWLPFGRHETALHGRVSGTSIKNMLKSTQNLGVVPSEERGNWYRGFELLMLDAIRAKMRECLSKYESTVHDYDVAKNLCNYKLIKGLKIKVIGCTTTGLAKYRPLLAALKPRTLLIEEAAETLEGTVAAGLVESLEQLILVGDHKQLQASCAIPALEVAPYHMNMSMFERLLKNGVSYVMLNQQRRMIPDVRKLLTIEPSPFYKGLTDHHSVLDRAVNRPPIPGMGGNDLYFLHHQWPDAIDVDCSRVNEDESEMLVKFFYYLVINGTEADKITVLTFYNGQRKQILKDLKKHDGLKSLTKYFKVFTVDSYQGEENDVILLSLVRSNIRLQVGFLSSKHRAVVALSRARRGLYMFGNALTLAALETDDNMQGPRDALWGPIIKHLNREEHFSMDKGLPLVCKNHGTQTNVWEPRDLDELSGGCKQKCGGILPCGHPCILRCHPLEHARIMCMAACPRTLSCGHGCSKVCGDLCECLACKMGPTPTRDYISDMNDLEVHDKVSVSKRPTTPTGLNRDFIVFSPEKKTAATEDVPSSSAIWTPDRGRSRYRGGHRHADSSGYVLTSFGPPRGKPNPTVPGRVTLGEAVMASRHPSADSQHFIGGQPRHSSPGDAWQKWDPKKADGLVAKKVRIIEDSGPKYDTMITDTFVHVDVDQDGKRKTQKKIQSFISPFDGADERADDADDEMTVISQDREADSSKGKKSSIHGMWEQTKTKESNAKEGLWSTSDPKYRHHKETEFFEGAPRPHRSVSSSSSTTCDVLSAAAGDRTTKDSRNAQAEARISRGAVATSGVPVSRSYAATPVVMPRVFNFNAERARHHQFHQIIPRVFNFDAVRARHQLFHQANVTPTTSGRTVTMAAGNVGRTHRRNQTSIYNMSGVGASSSIPCPTRPAPVPADSGAISDHSQVNGPANRPVYIEPRIIDLNDAVRDYDGNWLPGFAHIHGVVGLPNVYVHRPAPPIPSGYDTDSSPAVSPPEPQALITITEDHEENE